MSETSNPRSSALGPRFVNLALALLSILATLLLAELVVRAFDLMPSARVAITKPPEAWDEGLSEEEPGDLAQASRFPVPEAGVAAEEPEASPAVRDREGGVLVQHPFQGWASDRIARRYEKFSRVDPSHFVVGIFGGSVARHMGAKSKVVLERYLEEHLPESPTRVEVLPLGEGAYKQPQQLYVLSQLLLLGVPFDVVVNVDGFNEVALAAHNVERGVHPMLPHDGIVRSLWQISSSKPSPAAIELIAGIQGIQRRASDLRRRYASSSWMRHCELAKALMGRFLVQLESQQAELERRLGELPALGSSSPQLLAPCRDEGGSCWSVMAEIWAAASRQMAALSTDSGALYLHVLQPNQYVEGSKPLTAEELATAYEAGGEYAGRVAQGYPHLLRKGRELRRRGIDFIDGTQLFRSMSETIYADACCHYNALGNDLLAREIGRHIVEAVERRGALGTDGD
ncbi:MAG: hypothetical protein AAF560_18765 [Acidobacteriota bacterium]